MKTWMCVTMRLSYHGVGTHLPRRQGIRVDEHARRCQRFHPPLTRNPSKPHGIFAQVRVMPQVLPIRLREVQVPSTPQETRRKILRKLGKLRRVLSFRTKTCHSTSGWISTRGPSIFANLAWGVRELSPSTPLACPLSTISLIEGLASRKNEGIPDTGSRRV
jgi:hypothetical protein